MKKLIYYAVLTGTLGFGALTAHGQGEMSEFLKTGLNDGNKLMNAYASPVLKSFGAGLNAGWFNTAKVHGLGGFDITVSPNITFAPASDKTFDFNSLGISNHVQLPAGNTTLPTVFGPNRESTVELHSNPGGPNDVVRQQSLPGGLGTTLFVVPTAQLAVGVGFGTEVAVRYLPQVSVGDVKVGMFGFALKHDFKRWIPVMKELPFDLSAMFGYTSMNTALKLDKLNSEPQSQAVYNADPNKTYNQSAEFLANAYTFNILLSKKLSIFTPYLGVGYQAATTTLKLKGEYPVTDINQNFDPTYQPGGTYDPNNMNHHPLYVRDLTDPISIEGKLSGMRATAGFRLKFGPVTFHADYTLGGYNVASAGLGINIQSLAPFKL